MMKRIISTVLALALAVSLSLSAVAATTKLQRVNITSSSKTVNVGRTLQLSETVYPRDLDYDDVEWISSDDNIATVDDYGEVEGMSGGAVIITCRVFGENENGKTVRLGSGQIELKVLGRTLAGGIYTRDSSEGETLNSLKAGGSQTGTETTTSTSGKISSSTVVKAVSDAVVSGATTNATFKNIGSVSASTLRAAAAEMQGYGGTVLLNFDTLAESGKSVEGRVTINPVAASNVKNDIQLGVYTRDSKTAKTKARFEKYFKNKMVLMKADHSGNYGMNVTYAVKIGSSLSASKNLKLYSYDPTTNYYYEINGSNIWIDTKGYVHFTTALGDYLVVSDGALTLKK